MSKDHERIWLEPKRPSGGWRDWSHGDTAWPGATEYVRADLLAAAEAERDRLRAAIEPLIRKVTEVEGERDRMKVALKEIIYHDWWNGVGKDQRELDGKCAEIARAALGGAP